MSGEEQAFKDLVDKYTSPLYNFTARIAGKSGADDIVQEVFIKVWKNLKAFRRRESELQDLDLHHRPQYRY